MARAFDRTHLGRAPARFDQQQLNVWQKEAVHRLPPDVARRWLGSIIPAGLDESAVTAFLAAVLPNLVLPEDARAWVDVVFGDPPPLADAERQLVLEAGKSYFAAA